MNWRGTLSERDLCIDNLLVRIDSIIEIILVNRPCATGVYQNLLQVAVHVPSYGTLSSEHNRVQSHLSAFSQSHTFVEWSGGVSIQGSGFRVQGLGFKDEGFERDMPAQSFRL